jgi:hypothetical protein
MDRTVLNILSATLSGAGLWVVFSGYSPREATKSYWGENAYLRKQVIIQGTINQFFTAFAVVGLAIQVFAEVFGVQPAEPSAGPRWYVPVAFVVMLVTAVLVKTARFSAHHLAREKWRPELLADRRSTFLGHVRCYERGGIPDEHVEEYSGTRDRPDWPEVKRSGLAAVDEFLDQMEDLLELTPLADTATRLERIAAMFGDPLRTAMTLAHRSD